MALTPPVIVGLALAGAGLMIAFTAGRKLLARAIWRWKAKHIYLHAPKWPDKRYWSDADRLRNAPPPDPSPDLPLF